MKNAVVRKYAVFPAPPVGKPKAWFASDMFEVHVYRTKRDAVKRASVMKTPETVDWLWHGKNLRDEIGTSKRIVDHRINNDSRIRQTISLNDIFSKGAPQY